MGPLIRALQKCLGSLESDPESVESARSLEAIQTLKNCLADAESLIGPPDHAVHGDATFVPPHAAAEVAVPQLGTDEALKAAPVPPRPIFPHLNHVPTVVPGDRSAIRRAADGGEPAATRSGPPSDLPARFGKYLLLERIGRGGMGVVYKAEQSELNRLVALKTIRFADSATPAELRRFQIEAESAARLNHPNIVQVYEFGAHAGEQFFTMAYVEGQSLAAKLAAGPFAPHEAARLIRTIAEAVAFAHEHGVVHRDLKPANILLDHLETPHISDFGLAKKIDEDSSLTATGQVMGTPSYMAPEQAIGNTDDVGPLSDVYSLGAVLYALLVGRPPFQAPNVIETLKQVVDQEPMPPRQLIRTIDRDLETICLKCLAKEPYRRYASARAMAEDLSRFLAGKPVLARPVGRAVRCWRWCRREPLVAGALAAASFFLVAGSCLATYFAIAEYRRAAEADLNFRLARDAVDKLYTRVSENVLLNKPGMQPLRHDLLRDALGYYRKFLDRRHNDAAIQDQLALAHFRVGLITEEIQSPADALPAYQNAERIQRNLLAERPQDPKSLESLADTLNTLGRVHFRLRQNDAASRAFHEAIQFRKRLASDNPKNGEFRRTLANSIMNVGLIQQDEQRLDAARQSFEEAQAMRLELQHAGDQRIELARDVAIGDYNLGNVLYAAAHQSAAAELFEAAREHFERAAERLEILCRDHPDDIDNRQRLGNCYRRVGDANNTLQDAVAAIRWYELAGEVLDSLAQQNPDVPNYRADRAGILASLGEVHYLRNDTTAANASFQQASSILTALADEYHDVARFRLDCAVLLRAIAMLARSDGDDAAAKKNLERSTHYLKQLVGQFPDDALYSTELRETEQLFRELGTKH